MTGPVTSSEGFADEIAEKLPSLHLKELFKKFPNELPKKFLKDVPKDYLKKFPKLIPNGIHRECQRNS